MSVELKKIINMMERVVPIEYAEKWDNCGLLIGDTKQNVNKILLSIDPTTEVVDYAISKQVDLIITHHPITIGSFNRVTSDTILGEKIIKLIKNNIALYSAHTNLDKIGKSINHHLANKIGLSNYEVLKPIVKEGNIESNERGPLGYGLIGDIKNKMTLVEFANHVKDTLKLDYIHYTGNGTEMIKKVALVSGSGTEFVDCALEKNVDILVTGDLKYHQAVEAYERKMPIVDATHFGTESVVVDVLESILSEHLEGVEVIKDYQSKNPIKICK